MPAGVAAFSRNPTSLKILRDETANPTKVTGASRRWPIWRNQERHIVMSGLLPQVKA